MPRETVQADVRRALAEDLGAGDLTARLVPEGRRAEAELLSREEAVLCGCAWFEEAFRQLDAGVSFAWRARDGEAVRRDQLLCRLSGRARALLSAERAALNFLQTLSGTATIARRYAEAVRGTGAVVCDTRKTVPGLREAQKYAVRCGGCRNHRLRLDRAILIKENHIAAAGGLAAAVREARRAAPAGTPVEVEVEDLAMLEEALAAGAERILLDNFDLQALRAAVARARGRAVLEASGNVTLENVRAVAETGVDLISVGALTKHVRAVDLTLRFV